MKLVLENGNYIDLKINDDDDVELYGRIYEDLTDSIASGTMFNEDDWSAVSMSYLGQRVDVVNGKKIVGIRK